MRRALRILAILVAVLTVFTVSSVNTWTLTCDEMLSDLRADAERKYSSCRTDPMVHGYMYCHYQYGAMQAAAYYAYTACKVGNAIVP